MITPFSQVKNVQLQLKLMTLLFNLPRLATFWLDGYLLEFMDAGISPKLHLSYKLTNIKMYSIRFNNMKQVSCALCLLRSCPNLQSLEIHFTQITDHLIYEYDLDEMEAITKLDITLDHLEVVNFSRFNGLKAELCFVKIILSHSTILQRLTIEAAVHVCRRGVADFKTVTEIPSSFSLVRIDIQEIHLIHDQLNTSSSTIS